MENGCKIEWTDRAVNDFNGIIRYLSDNWSDQEIRKFVRCIDKTIHQIRTSPDSFPVTSYRPGLRRCVCSKLHTIYYLVENEIVYIITVWDNRCNTEKLKGILK